MQGSSSSGSTSSSSSSSSASVSDLTGVLLLSFLEDLFSFFFSPLCLLSAFSSPLDFFLGDFLGDLLAGFSSCSSS